MTGLVREVVEGYIGLRRGLGYRPLTQERSLRDSLDTSTGTRGRSRWSDPGVGDLDASSDPRNPARVWGQFEDSCVTCLRWTASPRSPPPGCSPDRPSHPPHVYSDAEITDLMAEAAQLDPPGGLDPAVTSPYSGCSPARGCASAKPSPCHVQTSTSTAG